MQREKRMHVLYVLMFFCVHSLEMLITLTQQIPLKHSRSIPDLRCKGLVSTEI